MIRKIVYTLSLCGFVLSGACSDGNDAYVAPLPNPYTALAADAVGYPACVAVSYRIAADVVDKGYRYGVCWNTQGEPTIEDDFQYGPQKPEGGAALTQVIPNSRLEYGKTYRFRSFVVADSKVYYGEETSAALDGEPLAPLALEWERQQIAGLPDGIEIYKTLSDLNGRKFQAWYAIADCSGEEIELRVQIPESGYGTVDAQAGEDCYVLVNGGYFDMTTANYGTIDGIAVIDELLQGRIDDQRGSWNPEDAAYDWWYHVTRGTFGVDASGHPAIRWAGTSGDRTYYYDQPLPAVCGEAPYDAVDEDLPVPMSEWSPRYAVSAGPVLLKNGECMIDAATTEKGYQLTNYEMWGDGLASASYLADQTVVGHTADGKVVLFVCDGRVEGLSLGATHREVSAILKSLGCVDALKLDGGGSTAMVVCGAHLNDLSGGNRPVATTLGFFRK
ncbi:MAG: phosphodiester glycosidase family protein [Alistipes sp.]|nr:phosphodiester glycosidase family protein [Alistipes senegalensis]MCM1250535.1 phosphodiester glycosidase family protein [Alistipes sp.]